MKKYAVINIIAILLFFLFVWLFAPKAFAKTPRTCFVPQEHCAKWVNMKLAVAKDTILVQAYYLTHQPFIDMLIYKKSKDRNIIVLLDKTKGNADTIKQLLSKNIKVCIDKKPKIAHNKVMIIDNKVVLTGSMNFSKNGTTRNAENMVMLTDELIVDDYIENFKYRLGESECLN